MLHCQSKKKREERSNNMKKKILIVDDDPVILDSVKVILESNGYDAFALGDCMCIEKTLESWKADLILLDIFLRARDGAEVAKNLKTQQDTRHIPIVMISANREVKKIAQEVEAEGYLEKPFEVSKLLAIVEQYA